VALFCVALAIAAVPLAPGAQAGDLLASHLLGEEVVGLGYAIQRHLPGFEKDPMARAHIRGQGTRVPIQLLPAHFDSGSLLDHGDHRFGDDLMRHADHDTVADLLRQRADMPFHIAGKYLVAEGLDDPLLPAGEMQASGILVAEIARI